MLRNIKREKVPNCLEICRRFITDEKDFSDINFDYITFDNNDDRNSIMNTYLANTLEYSIAVYNLYNVLKNTKL